MSFKQLWGSTQLDTDRKPTRVYVTLAVGTHYTSPWSMDGGRGMMGVEVDTSDGGAIVASALTLQRASIPRELGGLEHPTEAGVHWHDVPADEATLTPPNADGLEQMYEWSFSGAAMYRLKIVVGTQGNIWGGANI